MRYYDKSGNPIRFFRAARYMGDMEYKRVALDDLWWGGKVSTVWLGIDHRFGGKGKPLIFETMVFPPGSYSDLDMETYTSMDEALSGHEKIKKKYNGKLIGIKYLFINLLTNVRIQWRRRYAR